MKFRLKPHHKKCSSRQPDGPLRSRLLRFTRIRKRNQNRKLAVTDRYEVGMVISEILERFGIVVYCWEHSHVLSPNEENPDGSVFVR